MRLYLSSFRLGSEPAALLGLLAGRPRAAVDPSLAGQPRVAVVANAQDDLGPDLRAASVRRELAELAGIGLVGEELDLRRYFGRAAELAEYLAGIDLLWVRGGNAFVLRRAMADSRADDLVRRLLAEDALVYAGYSAGPVVLGPTLRGLDLVDDPQAVARAYPDRPVCWEGLAVLPYSILPHYRSAHPESDLVEQSLCYLVEHHLPFVALRDGEAILRDGAAERVVGRP